MMMTLFAFKALVLPAGKRFAFFTSLTSIWIMACLSLSLCEPLPSFASTAADRALKNFLGEIEKKSKAYGWTDIQPDKIPWQYHRTTILNNPLLFVQFGHAKSNCTLFLGGVHGDEPPTVYVLMKLANHINDNPLLFKDKCIIIAPLVNPDGFFARPQKRVNANHIDINRNFPTRDWTSKAIRQWELKYHRSKRYNPGTKSASEQETRFQIALIKRFKPQKILSVHSPLGFYDYDGPSSDLDSFEQWLDSISRETSHPLKKFGYFPGSLGNYAGHERNIFTLTLELRSSDPSKGNEYYAKFQPMILKFLNLTIDNKPPFIKVDENFANLKRKT
jgi:murein peptide amidase A